MNVEGVYNSERNAAVPCPGVTAMGCTDTPRGSTRGGGVSGRKRRGCIRKPSQGKLPGAAGSGPSHLCEVQCIPLSLFLMFMLAKTEVFIFWNTKALLYIKHTHTHIWFSNSSTLVSFSLLLISWKLKARWLGLDGFLSLKISKGRFGYKPLWPLWKHSEPKEGMRGNWVARGPHRRDGDNVFLPLASFYGAGLIDNGSALGCPAPTPSLSVLIQWRPFLLCPGVSGMAQPSPSHVSWGKRVFWNRRNTRVGGHEMCLPEKPFPSAPETARRHRFFGQCRILPGEPIIF